MPRPSRTRTTLLVATALGLLAAGPALGGGPPHPSSTATTRAHAHAVAAAFPGLPVVGSGHRPGPDILYAKPAHAPQLDNTGVWRARPILVSGADAYRDGEWLYQDYLYDDHGATGVPDTNTPYGASAHLYSPAAGTFTYPTNKVYANDAADLVEFRIKPLASATAFRVTLNTLLDANKTAFTIALGGNPGAEVSWPYGAGVKSPAALFLTWHGTRVVLTNAATGKPLSPAPTVHVDLLRRQVQLLVAHRAWNPGRSDVRTTIGVGLWNAASNGYLKPQPGSATATTPGGGTPNGVAIVNVGPRLHEPMPIIAGATLPDTAVSGQVAAYFWRERQQSLQLTLGDLSPFSVDVDFGKLTAKRNDDSGVPKSGPMDRILASHYSYGEGLDPSKVCFVLAPSFSAGAKCIGQEVGQLQPYAIYVPPKPRPKRGYGMTLLLHSLSANYNQYLGSRNQSQLGDRGPGSIVITPSGRGPDGFYAGIAEADTFETWADVARHYKLDPDWTVVSGYSMGGFGVYRLLARWPDLFARGFSVVGAPGSVNDQLISLRNTPLLLWNATADELVNLQSSEAAVTADAAAGLHFTEDLFLTADHLTLAANDQYAPGAAWLGTYRVNRDPNQVSFVIDTTEDSAVAKSVADHAYWLAGMRPRGKGDASVVVLSDAFGTPPPATVSPLVEGAGVLTGGEIPALAYRSRTQAFIPSGVAAAKRNLLVITATNLATLVIDIKRAHVTCGVRLSVKTDGPLAITLSGCNRTLHFTH